MSNPQYFWCVNVPNTDFKRAAVEQLLKASTELPEFLLRFMDRYFSSPKSGGWSYISKVDKANIRLTLPKPDLLRNEGAENIFDLGAICPLGDFAGAE